MGALGPVQQETQNPYFQNVVGRYMLVVRAYAVSETRDGIDDERGGGVGWE